MSTSRPLRNVADHLGNRLRTELHGPPYERFFGQRENVAHIRISIDCEIDQRLVGAEQLLRGVNCERLWIGQRRIIGELLHSRVAAAASRRSRSVPPPFQVARPWRESAGLPAGNAQRSTPCFVAPGRGEIFDSPGSGQRAHHCRPRKPRAELRQPPRLRESGLPIAQASNASSEVPQWASAIMLLRAAIARFTT